MSPFAAPYVRAVVRSSRSSVCFIIHPKATTRARGVINYVVGQFITGNAGGRAGPGQRLSSPTRLPWPVAFHLPQSFPCSKFSRPGWRGRLPGKLVAGPLSLLVYQHIKQLMLLRPSRPTCWVAGLIRAKTFFRVISRSSHHASYAVHYAFFDR